MQPWGTKAKQKLCKTPECWCMKWSLGWTKSHPGAPHIQLQEQELVLMQGKSNAWPLLCIKMLVFGLFPHCGVGKSLSVNTEHQGVTSRGANMKLLMVTRGDGRQGCLRDVLTQGPWEVGVQSRARMDATAKPGRQWELPGHGRGHMGWWGRDATKKAKRSTRERNCLLRAAQMPVYI